MSKTLEERLTGLLIPLPATVVPRVLAQARKQNVGTARRPPWLAPVAAVFLVLGFLAGSLYAAPDRKSTRLNSSHSQISYAVFCLKKKHNSMTSHSPVGRKPGFSGMCLRSTDMKIVSM